MQRVVRASLSLLALGTAAAVLTHFTSTPAAAIAPLPVQVTNTPLPVRFNNTSLPVTGTVAVSNLPTTPVYVDADRSARNGFNAECSTDDVDPTYGQAQCALFSIPEGHQVVIETLSCQAVLAAGQGPGDVQLIVPNVPLGGGALTNVHHRPTLIKQTGDSELDIWASMTPLRVYGRSPLGYGDQGVYVFFRAIFNPSVPQTIFCHVSGYVVGQ